MSLLLSLVALALSCSAFQTPREDLNGGSGDSSGVCLNQENEERICLGDSRFAMAIRDAEDECEREEAQCPHERQAALMQALQSLQQQQQPPMSRMAGEQPQMMMGLKQLRLMELEQEVSKGFYGRLCIAKELGWAACDGSIEYEQIRDDLAQTAIGTDLGTAVEDCKDESDELTKERAWEMITGKQWCPEEMEQEMEMQEEMMEQMQPVMSRKGSKESDSKESGESSDSKGSKGSSESGSKGSSESGSKGSSESGSKGSSESGSKGSSESGSKGSSESGSDGPDSGSSEEGQQQPQPQPGTDAFLPSDISDDILERLQKMTFFGCIKRTYEESCTHKTNLMVDLMLDEMEEEEQEGNMEPEIEQVAGP